jgi:hypothetical protein
MDLPRACGSVSVFLILPRFAYLGVCNKPINYGGLADYGVMRVPSHNPEVTGSSPVPAISVIPFRAVTYGCPFFLLTGCSEGSRRV